MGASVIYAYGIVFVPCVARISPPPPLCGLIYVNNVCGDTSRAPSYFILCITICRNMSALASELALVTATYHTSASVRVFAVVSL